MAHIDPTHSKEPIRLFQSDFLEFFTHIHPAVVLAVWAPVTVFFLVYAIVTRPAGSSALYIPLGFLGGVFLWTLTEYTLHRFLFHYPAHTPRQERLVFLMHGVHHAQPMEKTRLVMPPVVSIPMALVFYGLYTLVFGVLLGAGQWVAPLFSGLIAGYVAYDMTHYATHHFKLSWAYFKYVRRHHLLHHTQHPVSRYGVTSPLWDRVWGTEPPA